MKFIKTNWKIILSALIGAFLIYATFVHNSKEVKELERTNKALQVSFDSLQALKIVGDMKIDSITKHDTLLYQQIDYNIQAIQQNQKEIDRLKKISHEKITNINNASVRDLDSFFRSRYHY
jgi:hypothetical protein